MRYVEPSMIMHHAPHGLRDVATLNADLIHIQHGRVHNTFVEIHKGIRHVHECVEDIGGNSRDYGLARMHTTCNLCLPCLLNIHNWLLIVQLRVSSI
jgi:hypothetical protein